MGQVSFTNSSRDSYSLPYSIKALDSSVIFQFSMTKYIQILIRSGLDFHRLFSLKVKVIDENDSAPDFKNQISENMNLNFCRASLVRGINGDLFDAIL